MKKKKLQLAKLNFEKATLAILNPSDQQQVKGGLDTINGRCYTRAASCETIPYTQMMCILC
ncbi:hypothetical protein LX64_01415 [Chitinophaga skermanii]|uniref:Natural product n=1 Tax=Chitinophaga skermanii TaxID=331697 RepID=A0A327QWQ2_9BACT|nr:class I lanthipeptide [Chitinophaga skermanii]RAJ08761.1 hypothetical protein LX64_01415 [Chitinophaga skermanii]